jgi:hypothetical protein
VAARLTIETTRQIEAGRIAVSTTLHLGNQPRGPPVVGDDSTVAPERPGVDQSLSGPSERIEPATLDLPRDVVPIGEAPRLVSLRAPLRDRPGRLELVVDLRSSVDNRGEVSLSIAGSRLDAPLAHCVTPPRLESRRHPLGYVGGDDLATAPG